jgi:putative hydrolase of the HAD superfamily
MDYEAVFWDVGGVILDMDSINAAQTAFLERAVDEYDLGVAETEARRIWRDAMREHFAGREGLEYRTAREGRRKAAAALFGENPPADWEALYAQVRNEHVRPTPNVEATMATLHDAGVYQAVVSDADVELDQRLAAIGVADYLSHVTTSEEVGYVKPDRRMFETAFEKAQSAEIDPTAGIMVGDKYENDMEGASAVGLATAAFGAEDGPAVDHRLEGIDDLLPVVGVETA